MLFIMCSPVANEWVANSPWNILGRYPSLAAFGFYFHCLIVQASSFLFIAGRLLFLPQKFMFSRSDLGFGAAWMCNQFLLLVCGKRTLIQFQHGNYTSLIANTLTFFFSPPAIPPSCGGPAFSPSPQLILLLGLLSPPPLPRLLLGCILQSISMREGPINSCSFAIPPH